MSLVAIVFSLFNSCGPAWANLIRITDKNSSMYQFAHKQCASIFSQEYTPNTNHIFRRGIAKVMLSNLTNFQQSF